MDPHKHTLCCLLPVALHVSLLMINPATTFLLFKLLPSPGLDCYTQTKKALYANQLLIPSTEQSYSVVLTNWNWLSCRLLVVQEHHLPSHSLSPASPPPEAETH